MYGTILCLSLIWDFLLAEPIVCPEWCQCVASSEGDHFLNCQWPYIPDAQVFLSFPVATVTRLSIECDESAQARSKLSPFMFEKFVKLSHLSMKNCNSPTYTLPKSFAGGMASLKVFSLENTSLTGIESSSLSSMLGLEKLTIANTEIKDFPASEFCGMKDLKYLNFSNNAISSFAVDALFANCPEKENQVVILDLDNNKVTKLDASTFDTFRHLRILRLSNNQVHTIGAGVFSNLNELKELYLSNNRISTIDGLAPNLTLLDISRNLVHSFPNVVGDNENIYFLNLSRNFLDSNSPLAFKGMRQLTSLDLSFNRFVSIKENVFADLMKLSELRVDNNEIRQLDFRAFRNSTRLKRLSLANNKILSIKRRHFLGLMELNDLNLANNTISSLDEDVFAETRNLILLDLSKNSLLETPAALFVLTKLRSLDLSSNRISKVRKFLLDQLSNLRSLSLSDNKLTSLEKNLFSKLVHLKILDLSSNSIEYLQANYFDGLDSLEVLHFQENFIKSVDNVFVSLKSLTFLNVSENRVEKLDFAALPISLIHLSANHNRLSQVTVGRPLANQVAATSAASTLRVVDCSYNDLSSVRAESLPNNVEFANFSYNKINVIGNNAFYNKTNLKSMDLRYNMLSTLNQSSFSTSDDVQRLVYLSGNSFMCTCSLDWLLTARQASSSEPLQQQMTFIDVERMSCANLLNNTLVREIISVPATEFLCPYKELCIDTCLCCEFDVCDCKNVCPIDCQCFHDSKKNVNLVKCRNQTDKNIDRFVALPMYATVIYLDGGNLSQVGRNAFFGRYRLRQLYLNASSINTLKSKAFNGLTSLELLDLSDNLLGRLEGSEFFNTPKLETILLNGNRLTFLAADVFDNVPNLKVLTLHNNHLQILSDALQMFPSFQSITLGNNPWKCDCGVEFQLQYWLPKHKNIVADARTVYCYENLTNIDNATVLSFLPPTSGSDIVKVNIWTFINEINRTFCYSNVANDNSIVQKDDNVANELADDASANILLFVAVAVSILALLITVALIICICRRTVSRKNLYNKYSTAPSVHSSNTAPTGVGSDSNSPIPLLQYKAFISYSKRDENYVMNELIPRMNSANSEHHQICLLHRDFDASTPTSKDGCQHLVDEIIKTMERSLRVITVVSSNFIKNEWTQLHVRPAYHYLLRYKQSKVLMIVLDDLPTKMDSLLAHYIRTNRCLFYNDPLFWRKFAESMPDEICSFEDSGNCNDSAIYADAYGTIVPSRFI